MKASLQRRYFKNGNQPQPNREKMLPPPHWADSSSACVSLKTVALCQLCVVRKTALGAITVGLLESYRISPLGNDRILSELIIGKFHGDQHFSCHCHDFTPNHLEVFKCFCRFSGFMCLHLPWHLSPLCRRYDADARQCLHSPGRSPVTLVNLLRLSPWPWRSSWRWNQTDHSKNTPEKQMTGENRDGACCSVDLYISPEAVGIHQLEPERLHKELSPSYKPTRLKSTEVFTSQQRSTDWESVL